MENSNNDSNSQQSNGTGGSSDLKGSRQQSFGIQPGEFKKVAGLARLDLNPTEQRDFESQLTQALEFFSMIGTVNTEGVEPLFSPYVETPEYRPDEAIKQDQDSIENHLDLAPDRQGNLFRVPPVV